MQKNASYEPFLAVKLPLSVVSMVIEQLKKSEETEDLASQIEEAFSELEKPVYTIERYLFGDKLESFKHPVKQFREIVDDMQKLDESTKTFTHSIVRVEG